LVGYWRQNNVFRISVLEGCSPTAVAKVSPAVNVCTFWSYSEMASTCEVNGTKRESDPAIIITIIIIIIGKYIFSFMQGIPEINHVPKEHNVAAILSLLFVAPISPAPALDVT
jgi:hypothetical protein